MIDPRDRGLLLTRDHAGEDFPRVLDVCAYLSVSAGFLEAVISTPRLSWPQFLVFTALNIAWVSLYWYMSRGPCIESQLSLIFLGLAVFALGAQLATWQNTGFDWLLPAVTAAILTMSLPWPKALASATALFAVTALTMLISRTGASATPTVSYFGEIISIVPVYLFVTIFSFVMRRQQLLRQRAEGLADEVSRAKAELEQANAQLRRFSSEVEELTTTRERNRMAREIHDTLGHYLTILAVQLETATKLEERDDPRLRAELLEARRIATDCLTEVRRSVAALRPAGLATSTFHEALRRLVTEAETAAPGLCVTLDEEGDAQSIAPEVKVTLYRCVQEALTNVRKHARASKVLVRLRVEPTVVELTALDNGERVVGAAPTPGYGLVGMTERVALLGGTIAAGPEPERGWRVEVRVPLSAGAEPQAAEGQCETPATEPLAAAM
ncbi:MAG TPA: sensor histidine kinase [Ktedonobacterales bacterium]|nr:sensor histidine kinase [Ktedonobacterales bacterium]